MKSRQLMIKFESAMAMLFFPSWSLSAGQAIVSDRKLPRWRTNKDEAEKVNGNLKLYRRRSRTEKERNQSHHGKGIKGSFG
ncbi:hypothetical protein LWI28_011393 [Acer negundo]|uniref:Secreted protein n=1 Tax=Acer negundo TaxID=4023 RepID=A0AAD5J5G2_ACENE|nr:hypothetical protein LWI28_011393 [Acer negundo]